MEPRHYIGIFRLAVGFTIFAMQKTIQKKENERDEQDRRRDFALPSDIHDASGWEMEEEVRDGRRLTQAETEEEIETNMQKEPIRAT